MYDKIALLTKEVRTMLFDDDKILKELWIWAETSANPKSDEQIQAFDKVTEKAELFKRSLSQEQILLFTDYIDALAGYTQVTKREAFIKGVRLATRFWIESSKE